MTDLNFIAGVLDAETGLYVSGWEYGGEGTINYSATAPPAEFGMNMVNAELMKRNLPITAIVPATTITLGGVAFGLGGADAVAATGVFTATGIPTADQTVTIGTAGAAKVYTWKATVGATANQVLISAGTKATAALAFTGVGVDTQTFTVNNKTYTLLTTIVAKATAALAFTGVAVNTQTCTVNDVTYTFYDILLDVPGAILIGADQTETCNNLVSAVMGTAGAGTLYGTGTTAPTGVNSAVRAATTVTFTATADGTAANSFASTETCTNASFTNGATFTGGVTDTADTILIGANQTATCNNIVSAIMGTAGAGSTYGTGTAAPTGVDTAVRASTTVTFTATTAGTAANSFVSTETCTNASFGGATFSGGIEPATTSLANLAAAVNKGTGGGTVYGSATAAHSKVTATSSTTTMTVTAIIPGAAANAEATTDTSSNMSWGAATLTGGSDASA